MPVEANAPTRQDELSDAQFDEIWDKLMDESGVVRPVIL